MKTFGKYLFLILAFLSISEASAFTFSSTEVKEEQPFSSEKYAAAIPISLAYLENAFKEASECLKDFKCGSSSLFPQALGKSTVVSSEELRFSFKRDLRKDLQIQLFPKHFFL